MLILAQLIDSLRICYFVWDDNYYYCQIKKKTTKLLKTTLTTLISIQHLFLIRMFADLPLLLNLHC